MKRKDIVAIIILLCIALITLFITRFTGKDDSNEAYVVIEVDGAEYKRVSLEEPQTVVIDRDGKHNEVKITSNGVVMHNANCANQDCIMQGEVTLDNINTRLMGGWIVCLPNKVSVELVVGENL